MPAASGHRVDFEELVRTARWGGMVGLAILVPASCILTFAALFEGRFAIPYFTVARLTFLVRLGLQAFLMCGWGFAAVSLVRQVVSPLFGRLSGALVGAAAGTLVINLMAVLFGLFVEDAVPVFWVAALGLPVTTVVGLRLALGGPLDRKALVPGRHR